jgi:hypothetical protein
MYLWRPSCHTPSSKANGECTANLEPLVVPMVEVRASTATTTTTVTACLFLATLIHLLIYRSTIHVTPATPVHIVSTHERRCQ